MTKTKGKYESNARSAMSIVGSVVGVILFVVFGLIFVMNMVVIIQGVIHPERPPRIFGTTPLAVLSGSMSGEAEGHIEVGDLIFIDPTEPDQLEAGDVIAFKEGDIVVTHRIVRTQTDDQGALQFITKGDANNVEDRSPVNAEDVVGILSRRIPKLGDVIVFTQTPLGMLICIGVPVLAFVIYDIIRRQKAANREKARDAELERLRRSAAEKASAETKN